MLAEAIDQYDLKQEVESPVKELPTMERQLLDEIIDNGIINRLPAYDGCHSVMRVFSPVCSGLSCQAIRYPEISNAGNNL
ncbi:MAG: hypothetical protein ACQES8_02250 [Thermodesulfobacteriota bacterium]